MGGGNRLLSYFNVFAFVAAAPILAACSGGDPSGTDRSAPVVSRSNQVAVETAMDAGHASAGTSPYPHRPASRAYFDPETRKLSVPPSAPHQGRAAASHVPSHSPPIVTNASPAGGVMIDLRGAFSYGLRASASEQGGVGTRCDHTNDAVPGK
jgi:hypothetical protein